jgi:hypothetical protein
MAATGRYEAKPVKRTTLATMLLTALVLLGRPGLARAADAGSWKYQVVPNDGHVLTYSEDGKVTFYLGCGRGFALQLKYPGEAGKEGKARVTIASGSKKMTFIGEFVPNVVVEVPVPMNFATEFAQTYLGYAKNDPRVYGKEWLTLQARLYALLGSGRPLTIAAGDSHYQLPPIDAADWRQRFERCGLDGDGW